jgi:hypothetical protein
VLSVYIYIYVGIYIHIRIYIHMRAKFTCTTDIYTTHTHPLSHTLSHTHTLSLTHTHMYVCMYVYIKIPLSVLLFIDAIIARWNLRCRSLQMRVLLMCVLASVRVDRSIGHLRGLNLRCHSLKMENLQRVCQCIYSLLHTRTLTHTHT